MASFQDMFGSVKSKLGFNQSQQNDYDEYDDYDEYADYDEAYDDYADDYVEEEDDNDEYLTKGRFGSRNQVTTRTPRASAGASANLVSYSEARNSVAQRGAHADEARARSNSFGRTLVDSSLPPQMTPEGTREFSAAASARRSEGLDSLFSSTAEPAPSRDAGRSGQRAGGGEGRVSAGGGAAVSDASALNNASARLSQLESTYAQRRLAVLRPTDYSQAEGVVRTLKDGDAVILVLTGVSEALTKRLLDFAFGAACALGASVECVGNKAFAITIGRALTDSERSELSAKGIN